MLKILRAPDKSISLLIFMMIAVIGAKQFVGCLEASDPAPPPATTITLMDATSVLSGYTYAKTPKDRLPYIYLGDVSKKDFFTYYSGADRKFNPTQISYINQTDKNVFAVTRMLHTHNRLSRFYYTLMYHDDKLVIDWETSLKKKYETRMDQIARKKKRDREEFIHNLIGDIGTVLGIVAGLIVFLLPTIIGIKKEHIKAIYAINFLLLAFLLLPSYGRLFAAGTWVGCLIWSITDRHRKKKRPVGEVDY